MGRTAGGLRQITVTGLVKEGENGADIWRMVQPFELAAKQGHRCFCAVRGHKIMHPPDVLVFRGEWFSESSFEAFRRQCERDKVLVCTDYDDSYEDWEYLNRYANGRLGSDAKGAVVHQVSTSHLVTVTTERLRQYVEAKTHRPAVVVENKINLSAWQTLKRPDPEHPLILVAGSNSHVYDWQIIPDIFRAVAAAHPTVRFRLASDDAGFNDELRRDLGERFEHIPWRPFGHYHESYEGATIVIRPLERNEFNWCKTPINHWEATAAGAAFIGGGILYDQSVVNGENGYLAETAEEYIGLCLELLADEHKRYKLVSAARQTIQQNHVLTPDAVDERFGVYYEAWHEVYDGASTEEYAGTGAQSQADPRSLEWLRPAEGGRQQPDAIRARYRQLLPRDLPEGPRGTGVRPEPSRSGRDGLSADAGGAPRFRIEPDSLPRLPKLWTPKGTPA